MTDSQGTIPHGHKVDPCAPPLPGTYTYRQSGSGTVSGVSTPVPSTGTLVVDPALADGVQVWHRFIDPNGPPSDVVQRWTPEGVYLLAGVQRQVFFGNVLEIDCHFETPMLVVPWPATPGRAIVGRANCGTFSALMHLTVGANRRTSVNNRQLDVHEILSQMTCDGVLSGQGSQIDWVSWDLATIFTHQEIRLDVELGGISIVDVLTCDLATTPP